MTSSAGMHFGPQATKFMPSLEQTTMRERATLFFAVAHEDEGLALYVVVEVLLDGQDVGEHLGGMPLSGQAVPRHTPDLAASSSTSVLGKTAELDAVIHAAENASGILDGLLLAHLRRTSDQVG